jgi:hypothetical protein
MSLNDCIICSLQFYFFTIPPSVFHSIVCCVMQTKNVCIPTLVVGTHFYILNFEQRFLVCCFLFFVSRQHSKFISTFKLQQPNEKQLTRNRNYKCQTEECTSIQTQQLKHLLTIQITQCCRCCSFRMRHHSKYISCSVTNAGDVSACTVRIAGLII